MNIFRRLLLNPNVHIAAGIAATVGSVMFPAWAPVLQALAVSTGVSGIALPEQPAAPIESRPLEPRPLEPRQAEPAPALHSEDYAALAVLLAKALKESKK